MNDDIKRLKLEIDKLKLQQANEENRVSENKSTFSIGWFIFWLIIFWPISICYALYHHFKGK